MTDIINPSPVGTGIKSGSDEREALIKRRYAAEKRFKYTGLAAVLVSVAFLILLLITVVGSGIPAFTYNYVKIPVDLTNIDSATPEQGDYTGPVRAGIGEAMPYLSGRKGRRLARSIISGGAAIEVRNGVIADPDTAGKKSEIYVPISDFGDLYLKGLTAKGEYTNPDTLVDVSGTEGSVNIEFGADVMLDFLAEVKEKVSEQADKIRRQMSLQQLSLDQQLEIKAVSNNQEAIEQAKTAAANIEGQIGLLKGRYDALIERRNNVNSTEVLDTAMPSMLLHLNGGSIKLTSVDGNSATGDVIIPLQATTAAAGEWTMHKIQDPEENRKFSDQEVAVVDRLVQDGLVENRWNSIFFSKGASREPELAGIWGAVVGSFFTMVITLMLSFPLGVAAAIYLEEFAPKNKITALIEVNINNLAAVPSIVFGLLGLAVFLNFFNLPRSAPLVGGMVLALMTLPTIIIASRAALKAVPPSIREAALGVGASKIQAVFHHVLPLAMPGILTGTIIGMAQALGETAPLLMIGMVAFVVDIPATLVDPATVLPVQIYMWADFPEPGFQQKTAAAIMVLLGFLVVMNALAVFLRKRFERRW
ncbi:MAG: phosphate ABC transporter permease PstA [Pseudomonadota bacterium]